MRLLRLTVMSLALANCSPNGAGGHGQQREPIRVLVVTTTQGFRHTEAIDASKELLKRPGVAPDMRFDFTEDPASLRADVLGRYDVLFLDNSTLRIVPDNAADPASVAATKVGRTAPPNLVTREQQQAIAQFVRGGRGLVAIHSAVDAFYGWQEYRDMVGGGLFKSHPYTREARVTIEDPSNAAVAHLAPSATFREEYYYLDRNPRPNVHVLMSLDLASVGDTTRTDYPLAWLRRHGEGRVFVNLLGHFGDTWRRPDYLTSVLQGIRIAAGRVPADFTPSRR